MKSHRLGSLFALYAACLVVRGADLNWQASPGDEMLSHYFRAETELVASHSLEGVQTRADWEAKRELYCQQLFEMLGLSPLPPKSDLQAVVTGTLESDQFKVEKLHFQSLPGLYVTANLYLPKQQAKQAPAVLYVCGHSPVIKNGISYGNKVAYQHHGAWFARNGYVCLVLDTVQLGEIQGIHHGTYREGMWWWNSRGYTSAGVEAWNCIRALDYLQSRPEVDGSRIGVTGRSGGGAYSWWAAALDDRIKVAAPIAGITDLRNHVIDGTVEGHCDCMFVVNTYRWDYSQIAALVAPRPLLLGNSDKDTIFPLDGVLRVHEHLRKIYELYGAADKLGLLITEGPHKDTQDLQVPVFRWFNRFLKGEDPVIEMAATKFFEPEQLKVFASIPADERTSKIHETFVPVAETPSVPQSPTEWAQQRDGWMRHLERQVFGGWPKETPKVELSEAYSASGGGLRLRTLDFVSQHDIRLRLYLLSGGELSQAEAVTLQALDENSWAEWQELLQTQFSAESDLPKISRADSKNASASLKAALADLSRNRRVLALIAPRGIGRTAWDSRSTQQVQIRRRFMLLGETLDSMRAWDLRRAIQAIHAFGPLESKPLTLMGNSTMGVNLLYASLFELKIGSIELIDLPASHRAGPDYLNVLRFLDIPQAVAMMAERSSVHLREAKPSEWSYPLRVSEELHWPQGRVFIEP